MADNDELFADFVQAMLMFAQPPEVRWIDNPHSRGSHKRWAWNFIKVCHSRFYKLLHKFDGIDPSECDNLVGNLRDCYKRWLECCDMMVYILSRTDERKVDGNTLPGEIDNHPIHKAD